MAPRNERPGANPPAEPGFEQAMERLEAIVEELEGGQLTLEDSLARFEEGQRLSQQLTRQLEAAEQRLEKLVENPGGEPATRPLELGSETPGGPEGGLLF